MFFFLFGLFALGAVVGSFLNVCIWRLPRGESVLEPPSHCPNCDTRLRPLDLIPIVSQVVLRSRCRYCGNKISWRYCGMEVLTGVLFVMAGALPENFQNGVFVGDPLRLLQLLLFVSCLIVIFWIDYETMLIPMSAALLLGLAGIGIEAWRVLVEKQALPPVLFLGFDVLPAPLPHSLVAMIVLAGVMWSIGALSTLLLRKDALGFGDVFLTAAIAANIGWNASLLTFLFLSSTIGVVVGLGLRVPGAMMSWHRAKSSTRLERQQLAGRLFMRSLRKPVPFGPMLAVGALLAVLYGARLNQAYMQRFVGEDQNVPNISLPNAVTR
jgi:leader peptidase (prepilin peptidase)/N-methyltransferase